MYVVMQNYEMEAKHATEIAITTIEDFCNTWRYPAIPPAFQECIVLLRLSTDVRDAARAYEHFLTAALAREVPRPPLHPVLSAIIDVAILRCAAIANPQSEYMYDRNLADAFALLLGFDEDLWAKLKLKHSELLERRRCSLTL